MNCGSLAVAAIAVSARFRGAPGWLCTTRAWSSRSIRIGQRQSRDRFSGQDKVPILKHGDRVISNSWTIALYLEQAFPDRPTLFGGAVGETLTRFSTYGPIAS